MFNLVFSIVASGLDSIIGITILGLLYSLAVLIPGIAVAIRRLHDTNRSGWWLLIALVPIVGFIVLIVFFVQDSDSGTNQFGSNPKGIGSEEEGIMDHLVD